MGAGPVIREVTETLIRVLEVDTPDRNDWVVARDLRDGETPASGKLHVCMYAIEEHAHMRNQPHQFDGARYQRAPLFLRLYYVMAHFSNAPTNGHLDTQARLDRVVQVFHTTPIIGPESLDPVLVGHVRQLAVRLWAPTAEERNQIWTAFGRPIQLALYYLVDAVPVDLIQREGAGRIDEHRIDYGLVVT
jgi:hypothetical protein